MCIHPILLTRKRLDGSCRIQLVPCGKCAECRSKKHSDFACLSALEARACSSMYMVTLTYRDDVVPVAKVVYHVRDGELVDILFRGFVDDSKYRELVVRNMRKAAELRFNGDLKPLVQISHIRKGATPYESDTEFDNVYYTPSLRREDVRLWLKRCRVRWKRFFDTDMHLRYAIFGEYGSVTKRPHYHALFFDISPEQAAFLSESWNKEFGYTRFDYIPEFNADGSPARIKVANYVSKYIAKGAVDYPAVALNLVERPRRISSQNYGIRAISAKELHSLKNFINAKI